MIAVPVIVSLTIFVIIFTVLMSKRTKRNKICLPINPTIVYVTSCKKSMYDLYGKELIKDLSDSISSHDKIVVCTEDFTIPPMHNVHQYDISRYQWLKTWLHKNHDIIPPEFGGTCTRKLSYFNKNTSKWMRKVAAIRHAAQTFTFDILIWIDIDSKLKRPIDDEIIKKSFANANVFYHQGYVRDYIRGTGIETGIVGFYGKPGKRVLDEWFRQYESGEFRKLERWDDGYVFREVMRNSEVQHADMAGFSLGFEPMKSSPWHAYIEHLKGKHKEKQLYTN